jgi:UDP-glucose 4-epimerase
MKVLVLGGNGFIGSHLVDALYKRGDSIRIFDRAPNQYQESKPDIDYRYGNFLYTPDLAETLQDIDVVYHFISTSVPGTSNLDPIADIKGNLIATVQLLQQMIQLNVQRIVFLSSGGTVYGNPTQELVPETHSLHSICSYGIIKNAIENYLYMFQELYGLQPVVLRPSNPFGPRQGHFGVQGVIPTFLKRIINGESIQIWGDGSIVRDYIYISDLIELCVEAGSSTEVGIYNVGSGKGHSLNDIVSIIKSVTNSTVAVEYLPARPFDVKKITLDINQAREIFGWEPQIPIEDGLRLQYEWLNKISER